MRHILTFAIAGLMLGMAGCSPSPQESMRERISTIDLDLLPMCWSEGRASYAGYGTPEGEVPIRWNKYEQSGLLPLFNEGMALIRLDNERGLFDRNGELIVDLSGYAFTNHYMTEGIYLAQREHPKTIVAFNRDGEVVFETEGKIYTPLRDGYAIYSYNDNRCGIINAKGEIVYESGQEEYVSPGVTTFMSAASLAHPTWFPLVRSKGFDADFVCFLDVATGERYLEGLYPEEAEWSLLTPFAIDANDRLIVKVRGYKYGLLKLDGTWAVEPEYDFINYDGEWYYFENEAGLAGWMDKDGKVMIEPQFKVLESLRNETVFGISDWCLIKGPQNKRYFIDRKGEVVLVPEAVPEGNFIGDRCLVNLTHYRGHQWMNRKGELIGEPMFVTEEGVNCIKSIGMGYAIQYGW